MREYETTIIVQPEISDEGSEAIFEKLGEILSEGDSIRLQCESLGKRKLAYEIRKFNKGHYYILSFLSDGQVVPAIERNLRLNESILRFMTILANPNVVDIEARQAEAVEMEAEQARKAEERATREAEEASARAEVERVAAVEAQATADAAAVAESEAAAESAAAAAESAAAAGESEAAAGADATEESDSSKGGEPATAETAEAEPETSASDEEVSS